MDGPSPDAAVNITPRRPTEYAYFCFKSNILQKKNWILKVECHQKETE